MTLNTDGDDFRSTDITLSNTNDSIKYLLENVTTYEGSTEYSDK